MPVLRQGSEGPQVVSLKKKLKALGFKLPKIDGSFDEHTRDAVITFQTLKGLTPDGIAGPRTLSALPADGLDLPLHLFQILEEEHVSLYGAIRKETITRLNGREVTSRLNWDFYSGHIRKWERFKSHLVNNLGTIPEDLANCLLELNLADWRTETEALAAMNQLLGKYFYSREQFSQLTFGKATEKLLELYPESDELDRVSEQELREINRFILEELFPDYLESIREIRLAAVFQNRHEKPSAALCLSGGGIRSGTFALGLLQGMARHNLLKHFDYLSTVSGGGYIGGWLTAWIHRHAQPDRGLEGVTKSLTNATPGKKIDPDPPALRHLREYSNFLTPRVGVMSADTWTFAAIYVRNLLLNWSVIIPLLLAFLLIPRLSVAVVLADPASFVIKYTPLIIGCLLIIWAISYVAFSRPRLRPKLIQKRPWLRDQMDQRGFLKHCLFPLLIAGSFLTTHWAWTHNESSYWLFPAFGAGIALLALVVSLIIVGSWKEVGKSGAAVLIVTGIVGGLLVLAGTKLSGNNLTTHNIDQTWATEFYVVFAVPLFMLLFMLAATVFAGISSHLLQRVSDEDREWWARFSAWTLISAGAWALFSALVLFGPLGLLASPRLLASIGGISGIVALVLGKSGKTPATAEKVAQGDWKAQLSSYLLPLLAMLFLIIFVATLSLLTSLLTPRVTSLSDKALASATLESNRKPLDSPITANNQIDQSKLPLVLSDLKLGDLIAAAQAQTTQPTRSQRWAVQHMRAVHFPKWWFFLTWIVVMTAIGLFLARIINLNLFSLHNGYRNRLIRGFLAASRDRQLRRPNPFTGFDTADNVSMHELRPALLHEVDFKDIDGFANQLKMAGQALKQRSQQKPEDDVAPPTLNKDMEQHPTASEFIYSQLSDQGKAAADGYNPPAPLAVGDRAALIEDLNRILEADEIRLGQEPGFLMPPELPQDSERNAAAPPPLSQRREYHIHQNRRALETTYPQFIEKSDYPPHRLLHVVNTTLNLVGGDNLAWQQRKAESFTMSPLHCGSFRVGYRRSKDYGGDDGISLGTAMAISGAAASSNMGYYTTSPILSLVLTLFNVRLGWWLGNPGPAGSHSYKGLKTDDRPGESSNKIYRRMSPTFSIMPVFYEAFGLTDDRNDYVYLTDGGHFENLALYEMVLRRCKLIVVSDGAADAKYEFNDLANAVRKVRIDLGIHIEFPDVPIYRKAPDKEGQGGCYWSIGLIRYSDVDRRANGTKASNGILIYIKPAVYEDEPEDVLHYKRTHPTFPHETTADQFFDEPQFESYRALGSYIMDQMCGSHSGKMDLAQFAYNVSQNLMRLAPQVKDKYRAFWESQSTGQVG